MCVWGPSLNPLRPHLQASYKGAGITPDQLSWNKGMSSVRVAVEWVFGDIVNYFKFMDFKKILKAHLSAVRKMYVCCVLIHNARTCLYQSTTSTYFQLDPPTLDEYFVADTE